MESKKYISKIGMNLFIFSVVAIGCQFLLAFLVKKVFANGDYPDSLEWFWSFAPIYLIAFPVYLLLSKRVKKEEAVQVNVGLRSGEILCMAFIAVFCMVCGSVIGNIVTSIFQFLGLGKRLAIQDLVSMDLTPMKVLVLAVCAPIVEEIIFRKTLIDRLKVYGDAVAIGTSALCFGLFHGNFSQFFYATFLGLVFGYMYAKSGRLRYSICFHVIINLFGGVIVPYFLYHELGIFQDGQLDPSKIMMIFSRPGFWLVMIYVVFIWMAAIAGLVLFIVYFRKMKESLRGPWRESVSFGQVWGNLGMVLFLLVCVGLFVWNLILR